jgi:hypothetical protein
LRSTAAPIEELTTASTSWRPALVEGRNILYGGVTKILSVPATGGKAA